MLLRISSQYYNLTTTAVTFLSEMLLLQNYLFQVMESVFVTHFRISYVVEQYAWVSKSSSTKARNRRYSTRCYQSGNSNHHETTDARIQFISPPRCQTQIRRGATVYTLRSDLQLSLILIIIKSMPREAQLEYFRDE